MGKCSESDRESLVVTPISHAIMWPPSRPSYERTRVIGGKSISRHPNATTTTPSLSPTTATGRGIIYGL